MNNKQLELTDVAKKNNYKALEVKLKRSQEKLISAKQKFNKERSDYQLRVNDLIKKLEKKEKELSKFDIEKRESKALSQITQAQKLLRNSFLLLKSDHMTRRSTSETIQSYCQSIFEELKKILDYSNVIDCENR